MITHHREAQGAVGTSSLSKESWGLCGTCSKAQLGSETEGSAHFLFSHNSTNKTYSFRFLVRVVRTKEEEEMCAPFAVQIIHSTIS